MCVVVEVCSNEGLLEWPEEKKAIHLHLCWLAYSKHKGSGLFEYCLIFKIKNSGVFVVVVGCRATNRT